VLGGCAAAAWPLAARAQQGQRVRRVGMLIVAYTQTDPEGQARVAAFLDTLQKLGWADGRNVRIEYHWGAADADGSKAAASELVRSAPDVIVVASNPALAEVRRLTSSIPVVFTQISDPVGGGFVAGLARPGGNVTGVSDVASELSAKRMELLKDIAPGLRRVAMLWNANDRGMTLRYGASEVAAKTMGLTVQPLGVREPDDFEQAFAAMNREKPDAILMVSDSLTMLNRKRVLEFAAAHRLPAIYEFDFIIREGGLMSYSMDLEEAFGRVAALAARILKGAKPAELPFEQPTRFRFVLNLKTARALGLDVPPTLLVRADDVIE
jgi:putative tryptophan/tyrosine transport system substrate-binding protein